MKKEREKQSELDCLNESLARGLPIRMAYGPWVGYSWCMHTSDLQSCLAPFLRAQKLRKGVVARGGVNLCASGLRIEAL